ncbi:hypothetical protein Nepgr_021011 [Nepenthes gracilis]|uniref:Uncharacterized protein n=1 Tax=Nepenthes gracilis TaxID=150966 RepID=A0AAD3XWU5_NEPGR|nr:hypothetical protein Nepgr_021011 [Nepenthes gracilis]
MDGLLLLSSHQADLIGGAILVILPVWCFFLALGNLPEWCKLSDYTGLHMFVMDDILAGMHYNASKCRNGKLVRVAGMVYLLDWWMLKGCVCLVRYLASVAHSPGMVDVCSLLGLVLQPIWCHADVAHMPGICRYATNCCKCRNDLLVQCSKLPICSLPDMPQGGCVHFFPSMQHKAGWRFAQYATQCRIGNAALSIFRRVCNQRWDSFWRFATLCYETQMSVWCHADVAHFPDMDELHVRFAVCLASMEFCLFGGPAVLCFCQNAPIVDLQKCQNAFCPDWIFVGMQHVAINAGMTC